MLTNDNPANPLSPLEIGPDSGASPSPVADPVADVQAPAPGVDPVLSAKQAPSLARARAAQQRAKAQQMGLLRRLIAEETEKLKADPDADPQWVWHTKVKLAKAAKITEKRLAWIVRNQLNIIGGIDSIYRSVKGLQPLVDGGRTKPEGDAPETDTKLWKWNILDLFDRLMAVFNTVDEPDEDDEEDAEDLGDQRRTWIAWRVFLAAAFALPQEELGYDHSKEEGQEGRELPPYPGVENVDIPRGAAAVEPGANVQTVYERCTGRTTWPSIQARLVSLIVGRRGGKSYITAVIGIYLACCKRYRLKLGTKGMVMILARDKEQAGVIRGYILAFLKAVPELAGMFADDPTLKLIELSNGITIEVRAAGDAGTRGYTVVAALADEIAFWPTDAESAKQDKKVLRALRPSMLGIKNAMIVMLSSPYAKRGVLYENHRKAYGKDDQTRALVWQADTLSMRPSDDPELLEEIRAEYEDDPESAKAEYGANFRSDLENIYSSVALDAVAVDGRIEQPYRQGVRYRAFVDPSGGSSDSYVLAIAHDEERTVDRDGIPEKYKVPVLDKVREWTPKFDPQLVSEEVVSILKGYRIHSVTGDAYAGEWPRDPLKKRGIAYVLSEKNRSELYLDMLPVVNSGRVELLDLDHHAKARNQFANLERKVGRSGKDSVDHPPGSHDDVANAIAGVIVGCKASATSKGAIW